MEEVEGLVLNLEELGKGKPVIEKDASSILSFVKVLKSGTSEAAELYATTKPATLHWGVPTGQNLNCTDCTRLMTGLMAITGNLDAPGGNVLFPPPPVRVVSGFGRHRDLPREQ